MKKNACLLVSWLLLVMALNGQKRHKGIVTAHHQTGVQYGTASFYSNKFQGRPTANGKVYDKNKMTCAHNSLPFGTWVKVTNLGNKRTVTVMVTDRLHHKNKRLIDLSGAAAAKLGYIKRGLAKVKVEILPNGPGSE